MPQKTMPGIFFDLSINFLQTALKKTLKNINNFCDYTLSLKQNQFSLVNMCTVFQGTWQVSCYKHFGEHAAVLLWTDSMMLRSGLYGGQTICCRSTFSYSLSRQFCVTGCVCEVVVILENEFGTNQKFPLLLCKE